jgi:flap endonuclease-1
METERLSRLNRLTSLVTSYESLSEEGKVEVATSLQSTKDPPVDIRRTDDTTLEVEADSSDVQPRFPLEYADTPSLPSVPPLPATREDSLGPTLDEITTDLESLTIPTKPDSELPPIQTVTNRPEEYLVYSPNRLSSMLVALYSGFLSSVRKMGVLLSPRTVLPRPDEQDDETEITQELSRAQRRLVMEEESIWQRLSEVAGTGGTEGNVSFLARELEDKSAKILTSYERRKTPPNSKVYSQSRIILQAMGIPCIDSDGGVEGEALAAAIVRDGLADYVASEDTAGFLTPLN